MQEFGAEQDVVDAEVELIPGDGDESVKVVRTKRFPMKPMNVAEAILEMELLSHSFFLFNNMDNGQYCVVYRRQDGDYGLIEPDQA